MRTLIAALFALVSLSSITNAAPSAPPAMKGYSLFSWFGMECSARPSLGSAPNEDSWCYALLPGTNRLKSADELKRVGVGLPAIQKQLEALPRGTQIVWNNAVEVDAPSISLALPPERGQRAVSDAATRRGLKLEIAR